MADLATQQELNDTRWTGARKQGGTTTYILAVQEIELLTLQSKNSLIRPLGHNCPFTAGKPFVCVCVLFEYIEYRGCMDVFNYKALLFLPG